MNRIIEIKILPSYTIWLKFNDGIEKKIFFEPLIGKGISRALLNPNIFKQVEIENSGGLVWPNGFDVCPNFLKEYEPESGMTSLAADTK
ncbi:MAG: DUF2442 domain-containing protein [Bacteroidia bacterium]|nr:DUF2442 domain-containing protein [Bacteroidia bacterium]